MTPISLHGHDLRDVERELLSSVIDHELALAVAIERLPFPPFTSEDAPLLSQIFYVLISWWGKGTYDGRENRERLEVYFDRDLLEELWCPWGIIPEYVDALCDALDGWRAVEASLQRYLAAREQCPISISPVMDDLLYARLGEAIARLKNAGVLQQSEPPPPPKAKGTLDAFNR